MEHECVHARGGLVGAHLIIDYPDAGSRSHVLRPFEDHHHARIHATWLLPSNPTYHIMAGVPENRKPLLHREWIRCQPCLHNASGNKQLWSNKRPNHRRRRPFRLATASHLPAATYASMQHEDLYPDPFLVLILVLVLIYNG